MKSCDNEKILSILNQLLYDSKFDKLIFLDKATLLLLLHRSEKENQNSRLVSLIDENIGIRKKLQEIQENNFKSKGSIKLLDGTSPNGKVSITLGLGDNYRNLDIGEEIEGEIILKNNVQIDVFSEEGVKINDFYIYFGSALDDIYYLSLVDKPSFSTTLEKGDESYHVKIEIILYLSDKDKREILMQHLYENEILSKKEQECEDLYEILLKQFGVIVVDNEYLSAYIPKKQRGCCAECKIL